MDHLDPIPVEIWEERRRWFEDLFDVDSRGGAYIFGEHATGLLVELQSVYCAGAFISCVILSCTIVDANLRETVLGPKFSGGMNAAFDDSRFAQELEWLRLRRNKLVHFSENNTLAISVDIQYTHREVHENEARRAIFLVASVLFECPFV